MGSSPWIISPWMIDIIKGSIPSAIGDDYHENDSDKLYLGTVSPCVDPVVHASISKAEKRMKKLERDYQHTYKNFMETESNWRRFDTDTVHSRFRALEEDKGIRYFKGQRRKLQNDLEKLNKAEANPKGTEKPDYRKKFLMLHCCKSLAQEKRILQQTGEIQHPGNSYELIQGKEWGVRRESHYIIPKSSGNKPIHNLLMKIKEAYKLREKAIASENAVGNSTTEDSVAISIKIITELLTKVIKKLEKESSGATTVQDYCWHSRYGCPCTEWNEEEEKRCAADYEEKLRDIVKQCNSIREEWDQEKKQIVDLKKIDA